MGGAGNIDIETLRWSGQRTAGIDLELRIGPAPTAEGGRFVLVRDGKSDRRLIEKEDNDQM